MKQDEMLSVLFVCLGNICRSPSAHGVFRKAVAGAGLSDSVSIESAGTGDWHIGKAPDRRATAAAASRGIDVTALRAQQVTPADLDRFDYVLAMDADNLADLERMARARGQVRARVALFGAYSANYRNAPVPDPYFGGDQGFEHVLDMIEDASAGLLEEIKERLT